VGRAAWSTCAGPCSDRPSRTCGRSAPGCRRRERDDASEPQPAARRNLPGAGGILAADPSVPREPTPDVRGPLLTSRWCP
jgi:hypothetical protein